MSEQKYEFKGVIERCVYNSPDFKIYAVTINKDKYPDLKQNKYGNVSVLGELSDLTLGVEYEFTAIEEESKYGTSYKVLNVRRDLPTTTEGTYIFLSEILTENQAKTLVENYPNIIQMVKNDDLKDIDLSKLRGIGEKTFDIIKDKIITNYCLMELVIEFKNVLSMNMIKKIYDKYSSIDKLKENLKDKPYTTLTRISRVGFKTADSIILQLQKEKIIDFGYDIKTSPDRCLACILYILEENENEGHTKMNLADLRQQCLKIVPSCAHHFVDVIKDDNIYYNKENMSASLIETYDTEKYIADVILSNLNNTNNIWNNIWNYDIEKYREVGGFKLSDEQIKILDVVCKNNIAILNGFAGSGKTASTQGLIKMLKDNNKSFRLFSPTGRAAKVLHENTNEQSSTIHRGLGYVPPNSWKYDSDNKLFTDVVIVDEFSMVDIWLFKRLLEAIDFRYTKLLLIGDNAQLPSVSCGNLLHDFMEANIIPTVTLNKIFRYSSGGLMRVATDTRCCKPYLSDNMKAKATTFGDNQDYMFIDLASEMIPRNVVALYKKLLDGGNSIEDIQVLTSKNVGDCGAVVLNNMIQRVANHNYGSEVNMKVGDTVYYEGDLILQTVNNYEAIIDTKYRLEEDDIEFDEEPTAFVANGETGIIKEIYNTYVVINFNGIHVKYYKNDMNMVKLGYAISIHKSQGGGFKKVILCTPQSHIFMLNSNLLYVGLTRMKEKLYHLGTLQSVNQAVKKKANLARHTFMQELLKG